MTNVQLYVCNNMAQTYMHFAQVEQEPHYDGYGSYRAQEWIVQLGKVEGAEAATKMNKMNKLDLQTHHFLLDKFVKLK